MSDGPLLLNTLAQGILVSKEVYWAGLWNKAKDNRTKDIMRAMHRVYKKRCLVLWKQHLLKRHELRAFSMWNEFAEGLAS